VNNLQKHLLLARSNHISSSWQYTHSRWGRQYPYYLRETELLVCLMPSIEFTSLKPFSKVKYIYFPLLKSIQNINLLTSVTEKCWTFVIWSMTQCFPIFLGHASQNHFPSRDTPSGTCKFNYLESVLLVTWRPKLWLFPSLIIPLTKNPPLSVIPAFIGHFKLSPPASNCPICGARAPALGITVITASQTFSLQPFFVCVQFYYSL